MVILQEDHVEQTDTMVYATTDPDGVFLHHTHARCGFACVEYTSLCALEGLDIFAGCCRNTAHALHDVQHQSLGLQQGAYLALDDEGDIAFLDLSAILDEDGHLQLRIEIVEDAFCHLDARQDAVFLNDQLAFAHRCLGNAAQGGMIAIADVLSESEFDKIVNKFIHVILF